jgi:hypothetical protein
MLSIIRITSGFELVLILKRARITRNGAPAGEAPFLSLPTHPDKVARRIFAAIPGFCKMELPVLGAAALAAHRVALAADNIATVTIRVCVAKKIAAAIAESRSQVVNRDAVLRKAEIAGRPVFRSVVLCRRIGAPGATSRHQMQSAVVN